MAIRETGILVALPQRNSVVTKLIDNVVAHIDRGLATDQSKPSTLEDFLTGRPLKKASTLQVFTSASSDLRMDEMT